MPTDPSNFKILLDVPAKTQLALNFPQLAEAFAQIACTSDPRFAIGIFGGWGSGKTTLMQGIKSQVEATDPAIATVWFTAWRYEKEEHLIVPLLDVLREALLELSNRAGVTPQLKAAALSLAQTIGEIGKSLFAGFSMKIGIPGAVDMSFDANKSLTRAEGYDAAAAEAEALAKTPRSFYHASFVALKTAFADFRAAGADRVVIFVDDLDRCLPDAALEVLESMKLFFDLEGFVFVVGLDRQVVELSIEHRYREMKRDDDALHVTGESYLRKIFQVPYSLAPVSASQVFEYLSAVHVNAALPLEQWNELNGTVQPHLMELVSTSGFNPREFKRFINEYTVQRKVNPELDPKVMLALQTVAYRPDWAPVRLAILAFRDAFFYALAAAMGPVADERGDMARLTPFMPTTSGLPSGFLAFLEDPNTGDALVEYARLMTGDQNHSINSYLFAGEASRSSDGMDFLKAFEQLGKLHSLFLSLKERTDGGDLGFDDTFPSEVRTIYEFFPDESPQLRELRDAFGRAMDQMMVGFKSWQDRASDDGDFATTETAEFVTTFIDTQRDAISTLFAQVQQAYRAGL